MRFLQAHYSHCYLCNSSSCQDPEGLSAAETDSDIFGKVYHKKSLELLIVGRNSDICVMFRAFHLRLFDFVLAETINRFLTFEFCC